MARKQVIISVASCLLVVTSLIAVAVPQGNGKGLSVLALPDTSTSFGISMAEGGQEASGVAYAKDSELYLVVW